MANDYGGAMRFDNYSQTSSDSSSDETPFVVKALPMDPTDMRSVLFDVLQVSVFCHLIHENALLSWKVTAIIREKIKQLHQRALPTVMYNR